MREIDSQERLIINQLIRNARISDNQITKNTNIPLKTVNRKRKKLEQEGLLHYFTYLDSGTTGTADFTSRQMYILTFRQGITRQFFIQRDFTYDMPYYVRKHILESHLAEKDGKLALVLIIESRKDEDILEVFNAEIHKMAEQYMGPGSIQAVESMRLTEMLLLLHNYMPSKNMRQGCIREDFPDDKIFVTDQQ